MLLCVALDTRMDEDGYREPLVARRRRVEACVSLISSRNVVHDSLLVSTEFLQSVVVQFYSGCALTIIEGLGKSYRTSVKNGVRIIRAAAAEHTTPDGNARKAWPSYLYVTGAHISDSQTGGCCLSLRRWLLSLIHI